MTPQNQHPWIKRIRTQQHPLPNSEAKILRQARHHRVTSFVLTNNTHQHIQLLQRQLRSLRIVTSPNHVNILPTRGWVQVQQFKRARGVLGPVIHELGHRVQQQQQQQRRPRPHPIQQVHVAKALPVWTQWISTATGLHRRLWEEQAVEACPKTFLRDR